MRAYALLTRGPGLENFKGHFYLKYSHPIFKRLMGQIQKLKYNTKLAVAEIDMTRAALMY